MQCVVMQRGNYRCNNVSCHRNNHSLCSLHPSQSCVLNNGSNVAHFHHKWSEIKPHWFLSASFSFKCTGLAGLADVSGCVLWGLETVSTFNFFFLSLTSYIGKLDFLDSDYLFFRNKPILRNYATHSIYYLRVCPNRASALTLVMDHMIHTCTTHTKRQRHAHSQP